MKAVTLAAPRELLIIDDYPDPACAPDDVIVQIRGVGLCGTDLAVYDGRMLPPATPWIMGHEGGGQVVAVGANVTNRTIGQRVIIEPNLGCGQCAACTRGRTSACTSRESIGYTRPGLLAARVAVPAAYTWPVGPELSDAAIACFEPLVVAHNAVRRASVPNGADCLVVGAGSVGQLVCQALIATGANPYVLEPHLGRLQRALALGAQNAADRQGEKYLFAFETSGAGPAWAKSLESLDKTGTLTLIGFNRNEVTFTPVDVIMSQLTIRGHLIYDHPHDFAATLQAVTDGTLVPDQGVEAKYSIEDAPAAFAAVRHVSGKTWLDFNEWNSGNWPR